MLLCALALAGATGRAQPRANSLRLAVIVSIDGLSWEWLRTNGPWFEHGLRRLLD